MPHADFVHLRVHSAYSLSEGAIKVKDLVKLAKAQGMPAVAVTDTGNLFGALEFAEAASGEGVQPIVGCVLSVGRPESAARAAGAAGAKVRAPDQLVLLAATARGYGNLMKLVSMSYLETEPGLPPQVVYEDLQGRTEGLIALTGGPGGGVGRLLAQGQAEAAESLLLRLAGLFPGSLYVEVQRHPEGPIGELEDRIEDGLVDLAYAHGLPLVATNDCFFADRRMHEAHDALLCIADGRYLTEADRRRVTSHHYLKSPQEMRELFADLPEAADNTVAIARRCSFLLRKINPILPPFPCGEGLTEDDELTRQAEEGLRRRLEAEVFPGRPPEPESERERPYWERLRYELGVIIGMKFPGYFLIVSDFMKWTRAQGIPVGVRGSGATSIVAWALDITSLDPLRFRLVFERFLNPERVSMPDFDIDFCQERRDEVIRYVQEKYGRDRVAQIITFGKLQARAVVRDVGRVMQLPYGQVDRITKLIPNNPANPVTLKQAIDGEPALQAMRDEDETVRRLLDTALQLEGLYRHASTHAAGVVIADRPLDELVALYRDPGSDMPVTQFNMKYVESAGLVKFDFLGLKTLTVIAKTQDLIRARGVEIDVASRGFDDPPTYAMLSRGDSSGVFQLESSGMRDLLRKMRPDRIEDLIALVALYRPGPMDSIPRYIACKHGASQPEYLHPDLEPILYETFGVMTYQEDVMMIAQKLAGYTLGGADLLRRAMGKKIKEEMDKERVKFLDGCRANGIEEPVAKEIFDQAAKFAGYGFNKGHAAAYAQVAFQTAYLKANYPVEFMAATMTLDMGNTDRLNLHRQELARLGVRLLPPDVNASAPIFAVETLPAAADGGRPERAIRYALAAVKGVGQQAMEALVRAREAEGPFRDLMDLARRLDTRTINRKMLENLACAGAFDGLDRNRRKVHAAMEMLVRHAQAAAEERQSGQSSLFGGPAGGGGMKAPPLPDLPDWEPLERLRHEFDAIGFYLSAHPLDGFRRPLERMRVVQHRDLAARIGSGKPTRFPMAGIVILRQERNSRTGKRFAFVQLSDPTGVYEVMVFSDTLAQARPLLENGRAVLLTVDMQVDGEGFRLNANDVKSLDEAVMTSVEGLRVVVRDPAPVPHLKKTLDMLGRGSRTMRVVVELDRFRETEVELPVRYAVTAQGRAALKAIPGVMAVEDL
jgi:DNA polymerase-3 subunit alpha